VFDLSCANAQRLFSEGKKSERREASLPPLLNNSRHFRIIPPCNFRGSSHRVATITLPWRYLGLRLPFAIVRERTTHVYDVFESTLLVAPHETFVFARIN
jgi:hypothetical protein